MLRTLATKRPLPSRKRVRASDPGTTVLDMAPLIPQVRLRREGIEAHTLRLENPQVDAGWSIESWRGGLLGFVGPVSAVATPPSWAASAALVRQEAGPGGVRAAAGPASVAHAGQLVIGLIPCC
jgi:hypothetical protein